MLQNSDELCGIEAVRRDWIESLIQNLSKRISLHALYLFGSRANNDHMAWSDYDICVISDDFQGMRPWERMELALACWEGERALEPVCFTTQEFEQNDFVLVQQIRQTGIPLYPRLEK